MYSISVVIPCLNEEKHIRFLLSDLKNQSIKPLEILVIDGGSTDSTVQLVRTFSDVTLLKTKKNVGHQRNVGGENAKGNLIVFLDADVRLTKHFLSRIVSSLKKTTIDIGCPYYFPYKSTIPITMVYTFFNSLFFMFQKISPSGAGSCIVVTKKLFLSIGGFDSTLTYDDIAFIRKGGRKGRFGMIPTIIKVSDRRFRKQGVIKTTLLYILLSLFFLTGQFKLANIIPYKFDSY